MGAGVLAAVLIDPRGAPAAIAGEAEPRMLRRVADRLLDRADGAAGEPVSQVEVSTRAGSVYAVREEGWTLVTVTSRPALASLMFLDLRNLIGRLEVA